MHAFYIHSPPLKIMLFMSYYGRRQNTLLHFHGNDGYVNAPQYYIIHTLPVVLLFSFLVHTQHQK
jgi:hypothetical protein